ncbi:MAG: DUF4412 domain-containing protein, partial [Thermodesulfobacteria bacterium]|nr:DUF4412 domain-containing protein [Thermodesulfobacteriota bacterium]
TYIQKNKVKTVGPEGDYTIIDLTNGTMTMVDPKKKEYYSTTLDAMIGQMQKGMDKLKAHLEGMTPEQRKMIEQLMGISQKPASSLVLKKMPDTQTIAGFPADHYVITQNGKKVGEYWVSKKLRDMMLKELDKDKIDKFEKAMVRISSQLNIFGNPNLAKLMKLEEKLQEKGEIVKQIHYPNDINMEKQGSYQEIVKVREETIPASAFVVPSGYKKKSMPQIN